MQGTGNYRVYKDPKNFQVVEAATALEAFQLSGLKEVYKIERERLDKNRVIDPSLWATLSPEEKETPAPAAAMAASDAVLAVPAAPAETLSNDDVNKLLNN